MDNKSWIPTASGVLQIVTGVVALTATAGLLIALGIVLSVQRAGMHDPDDEFGLALSASLLGALAVCAALAGLLALVGGLATLRRRSFGWALAGSIASIFCVAPVGIAALILTVVGQSEFGQPSAPAAQRPEAGSQPPSS